MGRYVMNDMVYDTTKSEKIASGTTSRPSSLFGGQVFFTTNTDLYRTQKGRFFFVFTSDYDRAAPVSEKEAKDFLKKADYEAYRKLLGELEEA